MNALIQMLDMHPILSVWLALTGFVWLAVYASTRKPREAKRVERRRSAQV